MTHHRISTLETIQASTEKQVLHLSDFVMSVTKLRQSRHILEAMLKRKEEWDVVSHFRVAIFGSARIKEGTNEFGLVHDLAQSLVLERKIGITTGGGPGIMKAANMGVESARCQRGRAGQNTDADNVGILVQLPFEEGGNGQSHIVTKHENFSTRLQAFVSQIKGAYCAPGGIGTALDALYFTVEASGSFRVEFPDLGASNVAKIHGGFERDFIFRQNI